jgi:hypothetical protein
MYRGEEWYDNHSRFLICQEQTEIPKQSQNVVISLCSLICLSLYHAIVPHKRSVVDLLCV